MCSTEAIQLFRIKSDIVRQYFPVRQNCVVYLELFSFIFRWPWHLFRYFLIILVTKILNINISTNVEHRHFANF